MKNKYLHFVLVVVFSARGSTTDFENFDFNAWQEDHEVQCRYVRIKN